MKNWDKTLEASNLRGVTYDPRVDKFAANIMIDKKRIFIGSFEKSGDAHEAYLARRAARPVSRKNTKPFGTIDLCWKEFLRTAARDAKGNIELGAAFFAPDGQGFDLVRVDVRKGKVGWWVFYQWKSECNVCGADFETTTRGRAKKLHGMTRTCEAHRGEGRKATFKVEDLV